MADSVAPTRRSRRACSTQRRTLCEEDMASDRKDGWWVKLETYKEVHARRRARA